VTKAFGRDINEYYNNHFPEDAYLDDQGDIYDEWFDKYDDHYTNRHLGSFQSQFKRWLKQQSTTTVVLEVAKDEYEEVVAKLKGLGLKVVK
jgi:hypothetical protein